MIKRKTYFVKSETGEDTVLIDKITYKKNDKLIAIEKTGVKINLGIIAIGLALGIILAVLFNIVLLAFLGMFVGVIVANVINYLRLPKDVDKYLEENKAIGIKKFFS